MTRLSELIDWYVSGVTQFPDFRRAFVMEFLSVASGDAATWSTVLQIESDCDDFAEGVISESELKLNLSAKFPRVATGILPILYPDFLCSSMPISGTSNVPPRELGTVWRRVDATLAWVPA